MQVIKRDGRISEFDEGRVIKAITLAMSNTPGGVDIDLATKIATENGYNYPVNVSIGNFYFPTKEYSEIILPEGYYDALKIVKI